MQLPVSQQILFPLLHMDDKNHTNPFNDRTDFVHQQGLKRMHVPSHVKNAVGC
jgi:hypothetical protein